MASYVQTDTSATFNVGCSGESAADIATDGVTATVGGTVGTTELVADWSFQSGGNVAAHIIELPAPGVADWDGAWTIPLNITTADAGDILQNVYLCDWDGSSTYVTAGSASNGSGYSHTRGATGVVTVTITPSSYTLQSTSTSQPFIVVVWSNNDTHGAAGSNITPDQTITTPYSLSTNNDVTLTDGVDLGEDFDTITSSSFDAEGIVLGDTAEAPTANTGTLTDGVDLGDTAQSSVGDSLTDGLVLSDAPTARADLNGALTDGVDLGDTAARAAATGSMTDGVVLGDVVAEGRTVVPCSSARGALYDSFVQLSDTQSGKLSLYSRWAQSWNSGANPVEITGVCLRLLRLGNVDGTFKVSIYASSGTLGTTSVPTGSALVTSATYRPSTLSTSATDYWFPLSGWTPSASTDYAIVLDGDNITGQDEPPDFFNWVGVVTESDADATHEGNAAVWTGSVWSEAPNDDVAFKLYNDLNYSELDGITLSDTPVVTQANLSDSLTDGVVLSDAPVFPEEGGRTVTDGVVLGEDFDTITSSSFDAEGIVLGDAATYSTPNRTASDGIVLGDAAVFPSTNAVTATDGVTMGEGLGTVVTVTGSPTGLVLGDTAQASVGDSLTDGLVLSDAATVAGATGSLTDGLTLSDTAQSSVGDSLTDGVVLGDTATRAAATSAATDGVVLGDAASSDVGDSLADGISLSDALAIMVAFGVSINDGVTLGDGSAAAGAFDATLTDGVVFGDTPEYILPTSAGFVALRDQLAHSVALSDRAAHVVDLRDGGAGSLVIADGDDFVSTTTGFSNGFDQGFS